MLIVSEKIADELFEGVWQFCEVGGKRVKPKI